MVRPRAFGPPIGFNRRPTAREAQPRPRDLAASLGAFGGGVWGLRYWARLVLGAVHGVWAGLGTDARPGLEAGLSIGAAGVEPPVVHNDYGFEFRSRAA